MRSYRFDGLTSLDDLRVHEEEVPGRSVSVGDRAALEEVSVRPEDPC
jgi:hypothetical protein